MRGRASAVRPELVEGPSAATLGPTLSSSGKQGPERKQEQPISPPRERTFALVRKEVRGNPKSIRSHCLGAPPIVIPAFTRHPPSRAAGGAVPPFVLPAQWGAVEVNACLCAHPAACRRAVRRQPRPNAVILANAGPKRKQERLVSPLPSGGQSGKSFVARTMHPHRQDLCARAQRGEGDVQSIRIHPPAFAIPANAGRRENTPQPISRRVLDGGFSGLESD